MREIKFRACDKESKQMNNVKMLNFDLIGKDTQLGLTGCQYLFRGNFRPASEINLMQFTGLKDKNGKEIYEGDIVKLHAQNRLAEMVGPIIYGNYGNLCCQFVCCEKVTGGGYRNLTEYEIIEIIGNIYENPELLTPHKE